MAVAKILPLALLLFVLPGVSARMAAPAPEKIDLTPKQLRKTATHIVVGKVKAVYERKETEDRWAYTRYLAEVEVKKPEKGEGLKSGDLVYARYWTRRWVGSDVPPSTAGHRGLPKQGEELRIYLARNAYDGFIKDNKDGGFNVIGANGFERLAAPSKDD